MKFAIPLAKIFHNLLIEKPISENKNKLNIINLRNEKNTSSSWL